MTEKYANRDEKMTTERTDRQLATGTLTKQDVDSVIMSLKSASNHLDMALETDGQNQARHIARAIRDVAEARMSAQNAAYRLVIGK
jgi:hypothetical protein